MVLGVIREVQEEEEDSRREIEGMSMSKLGVPLGEREYNNLVQVKGE